MAGELSNANADAAARAAAMNAGALKRIEDAYAPDPQWAMTLESFQSQMDSAGHTVGGGYDDCPICQQFAGMLPDLLMQVMAPQEPQPAGFSV